MEKLRLFWAINLPEEHKMELSQIQSRLKDCGADAKWVECRNLHVTVKFLGETDPSRVKGITESVTGLLQTCRTFSLAMEGLGFFPGPRSPRVLWVGLKGEVGVLKEVAGAVDHAMTQHGFPPEVRKFSPHLTLARLKPALNTDKLIGAMGDEEPGVRTMGLFKIFSVDLMQSRLTRQGPSYTCLTSVKLNH